MARRVEKLAITAAGRDQGKVYILTEMGAMDAERWATRALLALVRNGGAAMPDDAANAGIAGLASMGVAALGGVHINELQPLLDDMLKCAALEIVGGGSRSLHGDDDVEEVATLLLIRERLLDLHLGGSVRGFFSRLSTKAPARVMTGATRDIAA